MVLLLFVSEKKEERKEEGQKYSNAVFMYIDSGEGAKRHEAHFTCNYTTYSIVTINVDKKK